MSSNLKTVSEDDEFDTLLKEAGKGLVVIDFHTSWCRPCKTMDPVFESLAAHYPKALFLKVDADKCFSTAMDYKVSGVPYFVIYSNKSVVDTVQGANQPELEKKLRLADMDTRKSRTGSEQSVSGTNAKGYAYAKLGCISPYIDQSNSHCFNDLSPTSFHNFLGGKKLVSGKGSGKMLLVYSFSQKLLLHSFKIKANQTTGPKVLRLFVNHPKVLDFNAGSTLAPSQEVTLSQDDLLGERPIELRSGSFQVVTNLQVFVISGQGRGNKIEIESLQIIGIPVALVGQLLPLPQPQQSTESTREVTQSCPKDSCNNVADEASKPPCCKSKGGKKKSKDKELKEGNKSSNSVIARPPKTPQADPSNANTNNNSQVAGTSKNKLANPEQKEKKERRSVKAKTPPPRENEKVVN